ncbi:TPA: ATP-grasp domain-containing protein [Candidatus Avacholeplasma faecigallinarum]|nr:ATP-grasp domain-containing protein [Candidatus Avacholeplasma faecigallinarum]
MNFIFISPAFPKNYYNFCDRLKKNKVNILGIGDTPYNELDQKVKNSLTEYYKVNSLENYDEVYRAVAFFAFKYGKIDFLESNNEYWLRQDAKLRTDFNITGAKIDDVISFTSKSNMKEFYTKAGVPVARYKFCTSIDEDLKFINTVGYPVVVKPNVGVGAQATYKIQSEEDLRNFYKKGFQVPYIMEEFIDGNIVSFDGICDANSNVVFCDNEIFPPSIMDIVNENLDLSYYVNKEVPNDIYVVGQKVLKAFNIKSRYFHLEFFRLKHDKHGLGKAGDIVALEVNMRPPGGFTPDMINFAQSVDTYQIYADIICYNEIRNVNLNHPKYYCIYAARRDRYSYKHSTNEIINLYKNCICMHERMSDVLSAAMGNEFFIAKFSNFDDMMKFKDMVLEK